MILRAKSRVFFSETCQISHSCSLNWISISNVTEVANAAYPSTVSAWSSWSPSVGQQRQVLLPHFCFFLKQLLSVSTLNFSGELFVTLEHLLFYPVCLITKCVVPLSARAFGKKARRSILFHCIYSLKAKSFCYLPDLPLGNDKWRGRNTRWDP